MVVRALWKGASGSSCDRWTEYAGVKIKARPFDYPFDGGADLQSMALLVIDLQIDFLSPEGYFAKKGYDPSSLRAIIPAVRRLVDAARLAGCRIIWTRQGFRADAADAEGEGRLELDGRLLPGRHLDHGSAQPVAVE